MRDFREMPAIRLLSSNGDVYTWDRVRYIAGYRWRWSSTRETDMSGSTLHISYSRQCSLITNITPMVPILLYCGKSGGFNRYPYSILSSKAIYTRLYHANNLFRGTRLWDEAVPSPVDTTLFHVLVKGYRQKLLLGFLSAIAYFVDELHEYESPHFLWAGVVPRERSFDYHFQYINFGEIIPSEYGLEFWYCIEEIERFNGIKNHFRTRVIPWAGELGIVAKRKTKEQMSELILPADVLDMKFSTIDEQDEYAVLRMKGVVNDFAEQERIKLAEIAAAESQSMSLDNSRLDAQSYFVTLVDGTQQIVAAPGQTMQAVAGVPRGGGILEQIVAAPQVYSPITQEDITNIERVLSTSNNTSEEQPTMDEANVPFLDSDEGGEDFDDNDGEGEWEE